MTQPINSSRSYIDHCYPVKKINAVTSVSPLSKEGLLRLADDLIKLYPDIVDAFKESKSITEDNVPTYSSSGQCSIHHSSSIHEEI